VLASDRDIMGFVWACIYCLEITVGLAWLYLVGDRDSHCASCGEMRVVFVAACLMLGYQIISHSWEVFAYSQAHLHE
jgi:hypothetical protein